MRQRSGNRRIVATHSRPVINPQFHSSQNDRRLSQHHERCLNVHRRSLFNASLSRWVSHAFKRMDVVGTAIRIARIIQRVDANENILGARDPGQGKSMRQKIVLRAGT